jgi:hypothetical protein
MPAVQRRVGSEVMKCLTTYASQNYNRYPWAAPATQAGPSSYYTTFADETQYYFGHLPDQLNRTQGSGNSNGFSSPGGQLAATWPTVGCNIGLLGGALWWMNWKDLVYYAVAPAYAPDAPTPGGSPTGCTGSNCLTVDPASGGNVARVAVFVSGRAIGTEVRSSSTDWNTASNYLEGTNATTSDTYASWVTSNPASPPPPTWTLLFQSGPSSSTTFNDTVMIQ